MTTSLSVVEALRVRALLRRLSGPVSTPDRLPWALFGVSFAVYWCTGQLLQEFHGHEAWNYFFNADCPRIVEDMASAQSGTTSGNAASVAHPLFVLLTNLPTALLSRSLARSPLMASLFMCHAAMAGSVVLFHSILKRLGQPRAVAGIFAAIYAVATSNWVFGSIAETYSFVPVSLLLLVRIGLAQTPVMLAALAAVVPFGINIVLGTYSLLALPVLFAARGRPVQWFCRSALFVPLVVTFALSALIVQRHFYPGTNIAKKDGVSAYRTWYSNSDDAAFLEQRRRLVGLHFSAYSIVAPAPRLAPDKISTFMWFKGEAPPTYTPIGRLALALWVAGLGLSVTHLIRRRGALGREAITLLVLVAGWLAGTAVFFVRFGDDLLLFSECWVGHVLLAVAVLLGDAVKNSTQRGRWLVGLAVFAAVLALNNGLFVGKLVRHYNPGSLLTL